MKVTRWIGAALVCVVAASGFAALSKEYADFATGPHQYLLTTEERKAWAAVQTDAEAQKFIDLFWARRDPTPGTPANEYRTLIEERMKVADSRFSTAKVRGAATERGKIFLVMGSPTKIRRAGTPGGGTIQQPIDGQTSVQHYSPKELWEFERGKIKEYKLGQPIAEVAFVDQYASNEWTLERVVRTDYNTIFERVASQYITQPDLTEVPVYTTAAPAPAAPVVPTAFKSDALRAAVDAARDANAASDVLYLTTAEFITPEGEQFVPVQLWVPASAGLTAGDEVTFFGAVDAGGGNRVVVYEEPVKLTGSNDGSVFYARSLTLAPGSYRGTFGLAKDGKPLAVVSRPLTVTALDKAAPAMSPLMLSSHVYALSEAQLPTDPYAFGGLKVVPKGNATFSKKEELWYFIEARNPGIDAATGQPKMTAKLSVTGTSADGKPVKMLGPAEAVQALELKGVPGHWAVASAMPLESFRPGEYKLSVQLTDVALGKTYDFEQPFRVVE